MKNHCAETSLSGVLLVELIFEILSWLPAILLLRFRVRLWNPITKLFSKRSTDLFVKVDGRAFDSAEFGLWYNKLTETYKVVAVLVDNGASVENLERTEVRVYRFGDNTRCFVSA
ncbi:hypothetical protein TanjilG_11096 [Lupinus angustifolius]|uniref:Uncharacterized protein n=1 Tax=Lupinus angustifolius TaxID=3871 RepID=A0A394DAY5_LUPAN|nr:hypothetical protein TanjilG_11096 [Lupinus angustifolius]